MDTDAFLKIGIPIIGIVVTAFIGNFKEEIKNLFERSKYKYLKGTWDCEWIINQSSTSSVGGSIKDTVIIKSVYGKLVRGTGSTKDFGEWNIKGKISENVFVSSYSPKKDSKKHNLGVIIIKVDSDEKKVLKGKWIQYRGNELVDGETIWTLRNS